MRRNFLSLSVLTILLSSLIIFQNCGKSGSGAQGAANAHGSFDNAGDINAIAGKVTPENQAVFIYKRLAGIPLSTSSVDYQPMVDAIKAGHPEAAAAIAVKAPTFYTLTIRDFADKMSTRDDSAIAPFGDLVATVMGVVRDDIPATELMTGNFYYRARGVTGVSDDDKTAIVMSNAHYDALEKIANYPSLLVKQDGQPLLDPNGTVIENPDPAGLLTTRSWMMAHAFAGTNRRMIEHLFKIFECATIDSWASTSNSDDHVGRDIGRSPIDEYNNKCKGCHTGMDGMRPATAYYDFFVDPNDNTKAYTRYKYTYATDTDPDDGTTVTVPADEQLVSAKFRRGSGTYPLGFIVKNDKWVNYADQNTFGWTFNTGEGMNDLGNMIAYSDGYRRCMVKRVFSSVCKTDLTIQDLPLINKLADDFKSDGYKLKDLFINVAVTPECLGSN